MTSMYFTDKVSFVSITEDPQTGVKTKATAVIVKCRVEDTNRTFKSPSGEIIEANSLLMWPKNVTIKKGDTVQFTEIMGVVRSGEFAYEIQEVMPAGGFMVSHQEVFI